MKQEDQMDLVDAIGHLKSLQNRARDAVHLLKKIQGRNLVTEQDLADAVKGLENE